MENTIPFAQELLQLIQQKYPELPSEIGEAFLHYPRHKFIDRFSVDGEKFITLDKNNLNQHLPLLYADTTLLLFNNGIQVSTISQPSLVLKMLHLLDLSPGHKVFELGTGSGWNAALMGALVGPDGRVITLEIIDEMARHAQKKIQAMNLPQVKVIMADAAEGYQEEAPFDRGIFTAGATDLPYVFYHQIRDGGKLLFVLKVQEDYDLLLVLRKKNGHFEEEDRLGCRFVPVTGKEQTSVKSELQSLARSKRIHIYPRGEAPAAQMNEIVISVGRNDFWVSF